MATAFDDLAEQDSGDVERFDTLRLSEILSGQNLAALLTDAVVAKIGADAIRDIEIDEESRAEWLKRYDRWMDMAMQIRRPKMTPWPGAANVKYPLLTTASIQFQARAYPAIVDGAQLVKCKVLGPDPDGDKRARADRIAQHMSWQLMFRMPDWESETDRLLLMLPIVGTVMRKTYFDALANTNVSELVPADDFVIDYHAPSLERAPRYAHKLRYYPHEVSEKVMAGLWLPVTGVADDESSQDQDAIQLFFEAHRNIDLDGDGYPEPYVVTCTKDGQVARIVPGFGPEEATVSTDQGLMKLTDATDAGLEPLSVVKIERRQHFTKYGFIPAPDGSFYDIGFGWLLEDIGEAVNGTINQMLDAGALQNAGGGFMSSAINLRGGDYKFRLGEWKRVDASGPINQAVFPMPAPGPSAVLFQLLEMLIGAAKEITSVQDILTGAQQPANTPATTTIATIEQAQKVMTAIFKRIHRSFGKELRILRRLNRDYLDDEEYFELNDEGGGMGQITAQDYQDRDLDVEPLSDPNNASDMQRQAKAQGLMMFNGDPLVNQEEIRRRVLSAMGQDDIKTLLTVPQPAPDPKVTLEMLKTKIAELESAAKVRGMDSKAAADLAAAAQSLTAIGLLNDAANLAGAAVEMGGEVDENPEQSGGVPGVEGAPGNAGVPDVPQGPAIGPEGGMGPGLVDDTGAAGAGGPVGPAGGPPLE